MKTLTLTTVVGCQNVIQTLRAVEELQSSVADDASTAVGVLSVSCLGMRKGYST